MCHNEFADCSVSHVELNVTDTYKEINQLTLSCLELTMQTLEKGGKYFQS